MGEIRQAHLARTVRARDHGSRDPLTSTTATRCDLDHITPWPVGSTHAQNLITLSRSAHRAKTMRLARTELLDDGTYLWRTLTGRTYPTSPHNHHEHDSGRTALADPGPPPF